jgi:hypothetical protein
VGVQLPPRARWSQVLDLQFFLTAVKKSAEDAVARSERLVVLRERYLAEAATTRSNLSALVVAGSTRSARAGEEGVSIGSLAT